MAHFDFSAAAGDAHKTGYFGDAGSTKVDWYTKRDGSGERVIRVYWMERRTKKQHRAVRAYSDYIQKQKLFPFSEDGLAEACRFAEALS